MPLLKIAPSILAADFGKLSIEAKRAEESGADLIHIDVMDGHFVPNITFGPNAVKAIKKAVSIPLDVHLMITHPQKYIDNFIKAGASYITVHAEAEHNILDTIKSIRKEGIKAGPAINPDKQLDGILNVLPYSDLVLIMSVFPGFGGQKFMPEVLQKVRDLVILRKKNNYSFEIEIDGGINLDTVGKARESGVDIAVAGTALYDLKNMKEAIKIMKSV